MNMRALPLYVTIGIFLVAYLICWIQFPNMLSTRVVGNLLTDNAYLGIVAVGMTVVIISGAVTDALLDGARAAGVQEVVYKPDSVNELVDVIGRLMEETVPVGQG